MTDDLSVRPYQSSDAAALSALYEASVRSLGARDYAPAQIEAWAALAPSPADLDRRMAAGSGVARVLLETAEALAPLSGARRLYAEASETARPVFERLGFSVIGRRDFEVAGVPIHNWAVEKPL